MGTLLVALLGMGACQVPTSYEVEMGQQLQIALQADSFSASPNEVVHLLQGLQGVDDASVSISETQGQPATLWVQVWGFDLQADALAAALQKEYPQLAGSTVDVQPLEGTVHGTLKDRLGEAIFNIHVSGETAEEIRAEILAQLAAEGFDGDAVIDVQTDGDTRTITIETTTDD